ncbi:hypothetical protein GCM10027176_07820 [Actinoallomurus bryophytorum]|uniref:Uncharacterized protein n=1 Tax=Actinoallomurus bryophytorum TaxID=1490222 RepID=A0A543CTG9_9ACTN|nr:hypothetical protein [Actinoallomurus bryophytorum]TQM00402.1 hypothetical protein FB559_6115 [Actinoallomurus bryophytorum]
MITSFGKYAVAVAAALSAGGLATVAAPAPARAAGFTSAYTCTVPMLGSQTAVLNGWLSSPEHMGVGRPAGFQLHIASLSVSTPIAIDSWTASAWVDVSGTESSSFQLTGSGGFVAAGQPLSGDLSGDWAPSVRGPHVLSVSGLTITANTPATGDVTAECTANEPRPVAATLMAHNGGYYPGWNSPVVAPYPVGWAGPYRPGWHRPIVLPPYHGGWHHHH